MADAITFTPYLGWVDVPNPNEPAQEARFITAADLKRYEIFGRDAAALLSAHATSLSGAVTRLNGLDTSLGAVNTSLGAVNTRLNNSATGLDAKAPKASPTFTGTVSGVTKAHVGLGNVDNTADTAKPVSTAQKAYIDAVGSRVTALEKARYFTSRPTELSVSTNMATAMLMDLTNVVIKANTLYRIEFSGGIHGTAMDIPTLVEVWLAPNNSSGMNNVGGSPLLLSREFNTHPNSAFRSGSFSEFNTVGPIAAGTYRLVTGITKLSGSGAVFIKGENTLQGRSTTMLTEIGPS